MVLNLLVTREENLLLMVGAPVEHRKVGFGVIFQMDTTALVTTSWRSVAMSSESHLEGASQVKTGENDLCEFYQSSQTDSLNRMLKSYGFASRFACLLAICKGDGEKNYVLFEDGFPVYDTQNLEAMASHIEVLGLSLKKGLL
jgi:hypothetical protein